jgi:mevalonate kinase
MVTVSAPGKVFLMGEHAVVYGKPALLSAVNLRLSVSVMEGSGNTITIESEESPEYVLHAIQKVGEYYHIPELPPIHVVVRSSIPAGYHVGSSAATAVATVAAVTYFLKKIWNPAVCNRIAYEVEKKQHGNPSGADNTAVTVGGLVWYRRELEFLKSIWQLPYHPHERVNHFFLIDTGKPKESTREMVARVAAKVKNQKSKMDSIFLTNEEQVKKITVALKEGDEKEIIDAIRTGEKTLEDMGVVGKKVLPVIREIEKNGGAAKILGGGGVEAGVGFLLCYHPDKNLVSDICKKYSYSTTDITLGEGGVRLDEK